MWQRHSAQTGAAMPPDTTGDLGSILGVWAHPDDEAYLSAGLMARAVDAGRRVVCVTATAGEAGFPDDDRRSEEARMAVRRAEMAASLAEIGVREHHWLGYRDGGCADISDVEAVEAICEIAAGAQPDTLLTFGPAGMTGHSDHVAVCRWSTLACQRLSSPPRLLYATKSPEWTQQFFRQAAPSDIMMVDDMTPEAVPTSDMAVWLDCDDDLLDRKVRALRAQQSQIEPLISSYGMEWFRYFAKDEYFRERRPSDPVW
jgi:LmbE family N-acetylglucosaminyl deacetylase